KTSKGAGDQLPMSADRFEVLDAPKDSPVKGVEADVARDSQAKPKSFQDAQQCQDEKRKNYDTKSTTCLPRVTVHDGDAGAKVVQINEKVINFDPSGDILPTPVLTALDTTSASRELAGGDAPVRVGKTVVEHTKPIPGPDLEKDAAAIRKATERDDFIDTGHDGKAILTAMEGKTPEQTLELMKIYARNNKGADLMQDLKEELNEKEYAKLKDQLQDAKALERLQGDQQLGKAHEELAKRARETMQEPELSKFIKDMDKFEGRAASLERQYEREFRAKGMSPEEATRESEKKAKEQIEKTYQNMERLLAKNDSAPVNEQDRILLAQEAMRHAADPK